jgi:hypothetical protein
MAVFTLVASAEADPTKRPNPPVCIAAGFRFHWLRMAMQLLSFLAGLAGFVLPGIWLARALRLGNNTLERWIYGANLGLALATYLAAAVSHWDLRAFYPLWAGVALVALIAWFKAPASVATDASRFISMLMAAVLLAVALTRFAVALPQQLPDGNLDPTFHLLLARKIQMTHHAIDDWRPFADVTLNYPTGSHMLIVVLAAFSRLPLEDVFRLLVPALGVLSTGQIYVLGRRVTGDAVTAVCSAAIYGLWAWYGSLDYFRWGGLPNELAMLMFISALGVWFDPMPKRRSIGVMAIFIAAMVLVHHHLMIVAGGVIAMTVAWSAIREFSAFEKRPSPQPSPPSTRERGPEGLLAIALGTNLREAAELPDRMEGSISPRRRGEPSTMNLLSASMLAGVLISFFLIPYAAKAANFGSTGISRVGEGELNLFALPSDMGRALVGLSLIGICFWIFHRIRLHFLVGVALSTMAVMFVAGEYAVPMIQGMLGKPSFTVFTPSRFLTDMNYFLPMVAAAALLYIRQRFKIHWIAVPAVILLATLLDYGNWQGLAEEPLPPGYIEACRWIQQNTSPDTIVDDAINLSERRIPITNWTSYLAWRRTDVPPLPVSEPWMKVQLMAKRIPLIMSGEVPPDSPEMKIVRIIGPRAYTGEPILWQSPQGLLVVQEWPTMTAATSHAN